MEKNAENIKKIAAMIDHTNLNPCAKKADIEKLCTEAIKYGFASVCVNPFYVPLASQLLADSPVKVCTVVGFPLGAVSIDDKASQAGLLVDEGAREIDMVVNLGLVKDGAWEDVFEDIYAVRCAINDVYIPGEPKILLKVILETCYLTDEEIVKCCQAAEKAGADFVKTSTGFAILKDKDGKLLPNGATVHAVELMRKTVGDRLGVKASGGVHNWEEAWAMVKAGASRIGASAGVQIVS
ncbi:deoxyribose-phosphate aldolase [Treponema sp.]|uniref:deoxyribose-phosphate aldolase n=1 Tax=Treponema sp. TaxID=166 RepID=UPI0025F2CFAB|nr:deoxyribose-phosphate aldolase [Treponema sp.]MBR4323764.1 deoxyribose-phosphate aldolase [Treponema sp.]